MEQLDDILLIREIQNGNRAAFAELVRRHSKYFFAIAYRFCQNQDQAEDILQNAFLKLWQRPHKFNPDKGVRFQVWFARVVVNLCKDNHRGRKTTQNIDDFEIADNAPTISDKIDSRQKQIIMRNAIEKLSAPYKSAINLGVISEMPYADVARIMGKSEGNIKVLVIRAKEKLRSIIKEQGYEF